jgi:hypothetical protein
MKNYLGGAPRNKPLDAAKASDAKNADNNEFPKEDDVVMMIFGGTPTCPPRLKHKGIL